MTEAAEDLSGIRERVRSMYERHPYPPPTDDIEAYTRGEAWLLESPNPNFHHYWPYRVPTDDLDILIAGCGTRQAAEIAAGLPNARIVATDIAGNSLAQTARLLARIGRTNVRLEQLPVEQTQALGQHFDLVISTGVLHHLADPDAGLRALTAVLRPEGSMYLMLYGRYGRTGVYLLQELFRTLGVDPETVRGSDFQALRDLITALPPTHPFAAAHDRYPDWQSDEGLVDLLLHVRDRPYTLPEVQSFLAGAGLKMQKLLFRARYDPRYTPLGAAGLAGWLDRLDEPARLAAGELFRASIRKHDIIACHAARPATTYEIALDPPGWDRLTPILAFGITAARPTPARPTFRLTWPPHDEDGIYVDIEPDLIPLVESFNGLRTVREAIAAAAIGGPANRTETRIHQMLGHMADADLLTFRMRG